MPQAAQRPVTPLVLGGFFLVSTVLTAIAGASLLTPGGPLDGIWAIKPAEHAQLLAMGPLVGAGFLALSLVMALASWGALRRRAWAWPLAVGIFLANGLGDAARIPAGAVAEGAFGVAVTAAILWWLSRPRVRHLFHGGVPESRN